MNRRDAIKAAIGAVAGAALPAGAAVAPHAAKPRMTREFAVADDNHWDAVQWLSTEPWREAATGMLWRPVAIQWSTKTFTYYYGGVDWPHEIPILSVHYEAADA